MRRAVGLALLLSLCGVDTASAQEGTTLADYYRSLADRRLLPRTDVDDEAAPARAGAGDGVDGVVDEQQIARLPTVAVERRWPAVGEGVGCSGRLSPE